MAPRRNLLAGFSAALLTLLCLAAVASADTMVLQPDGKIVVAGRTSPESGTLARLNIDGSLDTSFGAGGFVIDHRLPGFRALALEPDGRIVGAAVGGFQLARYLPNGASDPSFAGGGVGGWKGQPDFQYADYGPGTVLVRPDGTIVVGGTIEGGRWEDPQAIVQAFNDQGQLQETIGRVPPREGPGSFESHLPGLLEEPDGSLIGGGWTYAFSETEKGNRLLLARFHPGSGTDYDPGFGNGQGLVRPEIPSTGRFPTRAVALTRSGNHVLLAGRTAGTFMLARFNGDGTLDTGFGQGGYVAPPITGPAALTPAGGENAESWANGLAVGNDGSPVLGGGSDQWGSWTASKNGSYCSECPQPVLEKFRPDGSLDPNFGSGGLLHMSKPDGDTFLGEVEQVMTLADGKLLVKGTLPNPKQGNVALPWIARLNPDGSYDRGFGEKGLAVLNFPCTGLPHSQQGAASCIGSARVHLHVRGLRSGRPSLSLRVRANLSWAPIHELSLMLPRRLVLRKGFRSKLRVTAVGAEGSGNLHVIPARSGHGPSLLLQNLPAATALRVAVRRGALRLVPRKPSDHRKLRFRIGLYFNDLVAGDYGGNQTVIRTVG